MEIFVSTTEAVDYVTLESKEIYRTNRTIQEGETDYYKFKIDEEDVDIIVRLYVLDGDADLYVIEPNDDDAVNDEPSSSLYDWMSEHSNGNDVVFISRGEIKDIGEDVVGKYFLVAVEGYAAHGSEYEIEFETVSANRTLSEKHQIALGNIFDACCDLEDSDSCKFWKEGSEYAGQGKTIDLCHFNANVCDADGNLEEFDARRIFQFNKANDDLLCAFPLEDLKSLMQPSMKRFQMSGIYSNGGYREIFSNITLSNVAAVLQSSSSNNNTLEHFELTSLGITGSMHENLTVGDCTKFPTNLKILNLQDNMITGTLAKCLFEKVSFVNVQYNLISGSLPEIDDVDSKIEYFNAEYNGIEGSLPQSLVSGNFAKKLTYFNCRYCELNGALPLQWNNTRLRVLLLTSNEFSGTIPTALATDSPTLKTLHLDGNAFTGEIPKGLLDDEARISITLANNLLSGDGIPDALFEGDSTKTPGKNLEWLDVSNNSALTGNIKQWLQVLENLRYLIIKDNSFSGNLPQKTTNWPALIQFSASNNEFIGSMPDSNCFGATFREPPEHVGNGYYIPHYVDVRNNKLSGVAPLWTADYQDSPIQYAYITGNVFDCDIPSELSDLNLDCREIDGSVRIDGGVNTEGIAGNDQEVNNSTSTSKDSGSNWLGEKNSARRIVVIGFACFLALNLCYCLYRSVVKPWIDHIRDVRRDRALGGRFWELEEEFQEINNNRETLRNTYSRGMDVENNNNNNNNNNSNNNDNAVLTPYTQYVVNNSLREERDGEDLNIASASSSPRSSRSTSIGFTRSRLTSEQRRADEEAARRIRNLEMAERVVRVETVSPPRSVHTSFRGADGISYIQ